MPDDWQGLCSPPQECTCGELGYLDACEALSRPWPEDVEIETEPSTPSDESVHFSGFDEEAAEANACRLEHHADDQVFSRLEQLVTFMETDLPDGVSVREGFHRFLADEERPEEPSR